MLHRYVARLTGAGANMFTRKILLGAAFALTVAHASAADNCQLKQYASLDLIVDDNQVLVPVTLGGQPGGYSILDFDAVMSGVAQSAADALHLKHDFIKSDIHLDIDGKDIREQVSAPVQLGSIKGNVTLAMISGFARSDMRIVGVLGADLLGKFDVELDLAHSKLNLFSQEHCKGQVVYWTRTAAVAAVPMTLRNQSFAIPMQLDGKNIDAMFSAFGKPVIGSSVAHDKFGLDNTPAANGDLPVHKFHSLTVEGITITNPEFVAYDDNTRTCNGGMFLEHATKTAVRTYVPFNGAMVEARDTTAAKRCYGLPRHDDRPAGTQIFARLYRIQGTDALRHPCRRELENETLTTFA